MPHRETENYYRARAGEYEQIYYRDNPARSRELHDEVARLSALAAGKKVLELACGTGYWTQVMSRTAREITALDLSPEMIAQSRAKQFGCPVKLMAADMFGWQPPTERFDLVAVGFWISHQPRQEYDHFFALLHRCVRPTGSIWLMDNNPPAEGATHNTAGTDQFGNHYKKRWLENGEEFKILKNYFSEQELRALLEPHFQVGSLFYGHYYWSVQLSGAER